MARVMGRARPWAGKSKPAKVEIYTRWSFHLFMVGELVVMAMGTVARAGSPVGGWFLLLGCAHALAAGAYISYALDWALGRRARPTRLMAVTGVLSVVGSVATMALVAANRSSTDDLQSLSYVLVAFAGFGVGSLVVGVRRVKNMLLLVLASIVVVALSGLVFGMGLGALFGSVLGVLIAGLALTFTTGFSVWLVKAVWDLDSARELQARLAVAEERLRFGRDLHDVMGRNLAVIALKSELAVELAQRGGTDQAAAQMSEVQRIARESQREVRAVVRGYREVDLRTELEGARGVLQAAGIGFRLEGVDTASGAGGNGTGRDGTDGVDGGSGGGADGTAGLAADVQSALGWVVREAATNVLRHGDARQCTVRLTVREGCDAVLVVENDGLPDRAALARSGAESPPRPTGAGLAGLRERLATLGGTLDAGPVDGTHFRLTARVPLAAAPTGATETAGVAEAAGASEVTA
ncbi:histidine kinase [Streptomyces sp. IB2014 016-6]|uniref:sensor histidine kinase n=1 Tax=Streptomyces sp. IB2014 016-6 TaxID=2517818 RepID=UPI0011CCC78A|nr:histidine kinase [Streptomyces sp. IB2014 016-6]TXL85304.1 sensor histidine kinase [Streptomyces sp. IB2014 016-6]